MDRLAVDVRDDSNGLDVGGAVPSSQPLTLLPQILNLSDAAKHLNSAAQDLRAELTDVAASDISAQDQDFLKLVDSPAAYGMVRSLQRGGVDSIELAPLPANAAPREVLREIFNSGQAALREHGIPDPDIAMYEQAAELAQATGRPIEGVVAEAEAAQPLAVRNDLPTSTASISIGGNSDTVVAHSFDSALAGPPQAGMKAQNLGQDFEPTNYQEYDVHLMARPLWENESGWLATRDSHAFVVVTEKGGNPYEPEEALIVTRAGPDDAGGFASSKSGDDLQDEQSSTDADKGYDGDVYVASHERSIADDYFVNYDENGTTVPFKNIFQLQQTTITGNINELRGQVSDFREFINEQDIDYKLLSQNSNTYAGDTYELLTGDEPDNPHSGLFGRRTPALGNDLVNYEETDYANDFD